MNGHLKENQQEKAQSDQTKSCPPPKRFIFNVSALQLDSSSVATHPVESSKTTLNLPKISEFLAPVNLKDAYEVVCKSILASYNDIASQILNISLDELQEITKGLKIQRPGDCIKFIKEVTIKLCWKVKEFSQRGDPLKLISEYEKLLQQSETKVRELIRNEQIYRLNFEQLTAKSEEAERIATEAQSKIEESKTTIENMMQESERLTLALQHKDEELRSMRQERQAYIQTLTSNAVATTTNTTDSPQIETLRTKNPSWNSQNLKMLLNDNRLTPTEFTKLVPNLESCRVLNTVKTTSRTPTSTKTKPLQKSGSIADMGTIHVKNLKLSDFDKLKEMKEAFLNQVNINTERKKPEAIKYNGLYQSGRGSESQIFVSHSRGASCQTIVFPPQDQQMMKQKPAARLKARREEGKSNSPARIKQLHEFALTHIRTDSFDDNGKLSMILDKLENKNEEVPMEKSLNQKAEYIPANNSSFRRRSGVAKTRPLVADPNANSQKSMEQKSLLSNPRPPGSTIMSHRNISKGKSPGVDKKNGKSAKNLSPFVNIMLKKFTDQQELSMKKA